MTGRPLRLFVGVYPPEESRRALLDSLASLSPSPDPKHRVTPLNQVHMTVQFIGDTSERALDEVIESVQRSAAGVGAFSLTPQRLITLPNRGPVRLIAMETDAPPRLLEVHRRLAMRLAKSVRAKAGDRFLPHLTLCRFSGEATATRVDQPMAIPPFEIRSVVLVRSVLKPQGADHVGVIEVPL